MPATDGCYRSVACPIRQPSPRPDSDPGAAITNVDPSLRCPGRGLTPRADASNSLDPMVKLIKINIAREHEKSSSDQVLTSPSRTGKPGTGNDASTLRTDVVAALSLLGEMINEGSKLRPRGRKQGFPA